MSGGRANRDRTTLPDRGAPAGASWPGESRRAAGLTLLEVLIAIFVLSIGLLGVAALIPVGRRQIQIGSQFDRAAACGTAAMNELVVRDYLNPEMWMNHRGNSWGPPGTGAIFPTPPYTFQAAWLDEDEIARAPIPNNVIDEYRGIDATPIALGNSVCIDPLFIARNFLDSGPFAGNHADGVSAFPFNLFYGFPGGSGAGHEIDLDGTMTTLPLPPRMQRVTVRAWSKESNPSGTPPPLLRQDLTGIGGPILARDTIAERIFTWRDEIVFDLPANTARRPVPKFVVAPPPTAGDPSPVLRPQSVAEYSWFATATPTRVTPFPLDGQPISYRVSIVVCFKRDLNWIVRGSIDQPPGQRAAPKERMVYCELLGGGLGGGAARLWLPVRDMALNNNRNNPDRSDMPRVRPGQWIMLAAWKQRRPLGPLEPAGDRYAVFKWYKVASADAGLTYDEASPPTGLQGRWYQDVNLIGADWNESEYIELDSDFDPNTMTAAEGNYRYPSLGSTYATIVDGVVGVYETDWTWRPED